MAMNEVNSPKTELWTGLMKVFFLGLFCQTAWIGREANHICEIFKKKEKWTTFPFDINWNLQKNRTFFLVSVSEIFKKIPGEDNEVEEF